MPIVKDILEFREHFTIYEQGDNIKAIFGSTVFSSNVLAIKVDATKNVLINWSWCAMARCSSLVPYLYIILNRSWCVNAHCR